MRVFMRVVFQKRNNKNIFVRDLFEAIRTTPILLLHNILYNDILKYFLRFTGELFLLEKKKKKKLHYRIITADESPALSSVERGRRPRCKGDRKRED